MNQRLRPQFQKGYSRCSPPDRQKTGMSRSLSTSCVRSALTSHRNFALEFCAGALRAVAPEWPSRPTESRQSPHRDRRQRHFDVENIYIPTKFVNFYRLFIDYFSIT